MKIALIGPFPPFRGGIAQFTARLYDALTRCYPEHTFVPISYRRLYPSILFPGTSQLEPEKEPSSLNAINLIDSCNPVNWISSRKYIENSEFSRLIIQWWHPFFAASLLASLPSRIPSAAVCHNVIPHESFQFSEKLSKAFLNKMNLMVVHSDADLREAQTLYLNKELLKLYLPIFDQYRNPEISREDARKRLGYSSKTNLVLFFGLVRSYKGVPDLVRAMNLLPDNISLLIVGESYADRYEILETIASLQLSRRIRWIDKFVPDEDVSMYFNAADIVALPYRNATQSGVAQIALSFERILVLTDTGGLSEVVDPGSTGFLAPPGSPLKLAESITAAFELVSDPDTENRIRRKAASFSWETYAAELMEHLM